MEKGFISRVSSKLGPGKFVPTVFSLSHSLYTSLFLCPSPSFSSFSSTIFISIEILQSSCSQILKMAEILKLRQVEHVKNEKEILLKVEHPFIIKL